MLPKNRAPTSPGEILEEEFLKPMGLTQVELAKRMGVPIQRVNTVIAGKRSVTAETAILLSRALGTSPNFWMNLQTNLDLWQAENALAKASPSPSKAASPAASKLSTRKAPARKSLVAARRAKEPAR